MQYIIINIRAYTHRYIDIRSQGQGYAYILFLSFFIHSFIRSYLCVYLFFVLFILKFVPVLLLAYAFCGFVCFAIPCHAIGWNDIILEIPEPGFANIWRNISLLEPKCPHYYSRCYYCCCYFALYVCCCYGVFVLIVHKPKTKLILVESIAGFTLFFLSLTI